jgi:tRNA (mo5U34)-methyltransferase
VVNTHLKTRMTTTIYNEVALSSRVQEVIWFHQIQLCPGLTTPGLDKSGEKLGHLGIPEDLHGKTVLDLGCWDGFFAFECEKRGAERVVAVDDFVWRHRGTKDRGFDLAHELLRSKVEKLQCSFEEMSRLNLGKFDYVLMLGVLYHAPDPLGYLRRAREFCAGTLILETHVDMLNFPQPAIAYYPGDSLNNDPTNFWGPNTAAVVGMLQDSGFDRVEPLPVYWTTRQAFHAKL